MSDRATPANEKPPSVDRITALWQRVNDRKIVQWTAAYVAVAYAIQHAIVLTGEAFEWPHLVQQISMLLLGLGAPVVMTLAWYHAEKASRRISGPELTIIAILITIGSLLFYVLVGPSEEAARPAVQEAGLTQARRAAADPHGALSVAVLPFENLSGDAGQEFFSDGMTQEIVAALTKIPDLRVVARGSASQFKNEHKDLRAVGQALGATHLIEGSVRKAGDRVRITAQLVKADDGVNVWVNSYDREMTDVFAIQEDIATAIARALRMPLGLKPGEQLVGNRSIDPASYEQYLRGKTALLKLRAAYPEQLAILEPLVQHNPNYAPGWAALAQAYNFAAQVFAVRANQGDAPEASMHVSNGYLEKSYAAARRTIELDPESVEGLLAQGYSQKGLAQAEEFSNKALALDPTNPIALTRRAYFLLGVGQLKEGLALMQELHELEPFVPGYEFNRAEALWLNGQTNAAIAVVKPLVRNAGGLVDLARMYAALGRYKEAAAALRSITAGTNKDLAPAAAALLETAPAKTAAPEKLPLLGNLGFIYLYVGAPERALDYYEQPMIGAGLDLALLWHPSYAALRKTERFKKIVRTAGLVDYWRAKGWPQFCHPTIGDDFACE